MYIGFDGEPYRKNRCSRIGSEYNYCRVEYRSKINYSYALHGRVGFRSLKISIAFPYRLLLISRRYALFTGRTANICVSARAPVPFNCRL